MQSKTLSRIGLALLGGGVVLFLTVSVMNRRTLWLPFASDLPLVAGETIALEFTPRRDSFYEIQIEADDSIGDADRKRYLTVTEGLSELDLVWAVTRGGETIASGGSRDYLFVELGPPSRLGRLRRILLRIPYCQNRRQWQTLGLGGSTTSARGIGRFKADSGADYTLQVTPAADYPTLANNGARLVVRPDRRLWLAHFASTRPLGYLSLLTLAGGVSLLLLGRFSRWRDTRD